MQWLLKKGQDLSSMSKSHTYTELSACFWPHSPRSITLDLLASNADVAPNRSVDKVFCSTRSMVMTRLTNRLQDVFTVATLDVDLTGVPQNAYTTHLSPQGSFFYVLDLRVEMCIQSSLEFSLLVNGVRYGAVTANYS